MKTKTCPYCKENKEFSEFYKNGLRSDGVSFECKECAKKRRRIYHEKNGESERRKHILSKGAQAHYHDAKKRKYPPDYRILCHNCNNAFGHYGHCPHQNDMPEEAKLKNIATHGG